MIEEITMIKKSSLLLTISCLLVIVFCYAQYSDPQTLQHQPENLYPQPGPGELLIVDQLKETNKQLQEQTRLLTEQNRILVDTLEHMKKHDMTAKPPSK
jgi:hypothetical protein